MHKRLLQALVSVSSVSSEAQALAGQLITNSSPELIASLQKKVSDLEAQVSELTMKLIPDDEELTEKEVTELSAIIARRVSNADEQQLNLYDKKYLLQHPKPIRYIIAKALRNRAVELKVRPLDVWVDTLALDGEIK